MKKGIFAGSRPSGGARRRGLARIRELLAQELLNYFLTGLPALAAATLFGAAIWLAAKSGSLLLTLLAGLLTGLPLGLGLSGLVDAILRTLRDMPGSCWENYRRAFRMNAAQSLVFGALLGLILSGQLFSLWARVNTGLTVLCLALLSGLTLYVWPQIVLVRLRSFDILRNAAVLLLAHPLRSLEGLGIAAVWSFLLWLFFPLSLFLWAIGGLWFPALLILQTLSGVLEETFHAEETLTEGKGSA